MGSISRVVLVVFVVDIIDLPGLVHLDHLVEDGAVLVQISLYDGGPDPVGFVREDPPSLPAGIVAAFGLSPADGPVVETFHLCVVGHHQFRSVQRTMQCISLMCNA